MLLNVLSDIPTHGIIHLRIEVLTDVVTDVRLHVFLNVRAHGTRGLSS